MEPYNKRVNATERAMCTFKNHLIVGPCTTYTLFPLQLWDRLIEQTKDTLNMFRTARANPRLSAYAYLYGNFDLKKTPLAPPGTRAVICNEPKKAYHLFYLRHRDLIYWSSQRSLPALQILQPVIS